MKKEKNNDRSQGQECGDELRLRGWRWLPLQPLHLQELQLLIVDN
jgi:hypothetical protein